MTSHILIATIALATTVGCAPPVPEQQFLNDAMTALGGRSRAEAAKTLVIEGKGVNYNLGQDMKPEAATQTFEITGYVRKIDMANRARTCITPRVRREGPTGPRATAVRNGVRP